MIWIEDVIECFVRYLVESRIDGFGDNEDSSGKITIKLLVPL